MATFRFKQPPVTWSPDVQARARYLETIGEADYWAVDGNVYKYENGVARWFCTMYAWEGNLYFLRRDHG